MDLVESRISGQKEVKTLPAARNFFDETFLGGKAMVC